MLPVLPVANIANSQLALGVGIGNISTLATFAIAPAARAEQPAYTNHAGFISV